MECFVQPFGASYPQLSEALLNTIGEVGLVAQIDHWQLSWLKVPTAPYIEVLNFGNHTHEGSVLKSPHFKLAPQDIHVLESDPAMRQRCAEHPLGQDNQSCEHQESAPNQI
jgi:hypothetical protein